MAEGDGKHEDMVENMILKMREIEGFTGYVICNNNGIVIRYEGRTYDEAVHLVSGVLGLYQKSKLAVTHLLNPEDSAIENIRLKSNDYELVVSQEGNFTMIATQNFHHVTVGDEEEVKEEVVE
eukprot:CAMPEP_0114388120 /NCGR_PEP_ID=MMETSP0102-20121206/7725_1 /TAXON_ID=38822 ORGANISM="Pteridomonas danica, Strain PT" /NCGR_SAMPLE_ID=MMETSP0102 /ASSEMBLY_ACC=CAM_ASM_000212 /LENGTH=122 /DNA_ID=CAMNT_0001545471 /DNA_START=27 /DNA_END=395 /DNA_ORIENTATION=+